jgi:hypothetical protein
VTKKNDRRSARASSIAGALDVAQNRRGPIEPPPCAALNDAARAIFDGIIRTRSPEEWEAGGEAHLHVAAALARDFETIERLSAAVLAEGEVTASGRLNPKSKLIDAASSRTMRAVRLLQLQGRALGGELRDVQRRRELQNTTAAGLDHDDNLGLLA